MLSALNHTLLIAVTRSFSSNNRNDTLQSFDIKPVLCQEGKFSKFSTAHATTHLFMPRYAFRVFDDLLLRWIFLTSEGWRLRASLPLTTIV